MIKFNCRDYFNNNARTWQGYISKLVYSECNLEISILLPQPFTACVCKTLSGFFVFFTHYECGVNLYSLFDSKENAGRLAAIFDDKDAITVASAIGKVGYLLSSPRKRRKTVPNPAYNEEDLPF
jgi:hypothetical protein